MPNFRPGLGDDTGRVVRLEHGHLEYRLTPGGGCEIVNVEVDNDHRREGIGRKLVEKLIKEVQGYGVQKLWAITRIENEIAQQWYERLQFHVVGVLRRFYGDAKQADGIMYGRQPGGPV